MVELDGSELKRLVQDLRSESTTYYRQFVIWLGVGSAGAGIALVTLATKLPDPNYALRVFLPSLWAFLIGIIAAGLAVLFASYAISWAAEHFAESHNREQISQAVHKIPEMFSSPRSIAEAANKPRNDLIERANKAHEKAEGAWTRHVFWRKARNGAVAASGIAFALGMGWPIAFVTFGGTLAR